MSSPHASEDPHWEAALEHYHWDRLEDAYREAREHGVGEAGSLLRWLRVIEAETITRRKSERVPVTPWLTLECVASEVLDLRQTLIDRALHACDQVAGRLGWVHSEQTLLTILSEETESRFQINPYGYCVSKEPYEKICLPAYLIDEPEEYMQAVAHEYAHVISASLADGYAPRWLEEAISVLVEQRFDSEAWGAFLSGDAVWHDPRALELILESRSDDTEEAANDIWFAYQQAGWIGRYLVAQGDETRLGKLLKALADEGMWHNLRLLLRNRERVDGALESLYGMTAAELFGEAHRWMTAHPLGA